MQGFGLRISQRFCTQFTDLLVVAVWFGLVSGMIEGAVFLFVMKVADRAGMEVAKEILYVSPVFNVVLFVLSGLVLAAAFRVFPRLPIVGLSVFFFTLVSVSDWLELLSMPWPVHKCSLLTLALGMATAFTRYFCNHTEMIMCFCRRTLPWVSATVVLVFVIQDGFGVSERAMTARLPLASRDLPNILVIVIDTLRADHVSSYNY